MKYAMIVALVLLGACAPDDADPGDEGASEVTPTAQAPLGKTSEPATVTMADTPSTQPLVEKGGPALNKIFKLPASGFKPGSGVMVPHTDSDKPQPQPWVPPDQGSIPERDESRPETKVVQGTAP
jgi:hypothetical protein